MDELLSLIKNKSFRQGTFTLTSGATSQDFFDLKPTMLDPYGANLIADRVWHVTRNFYVDAIGGPVTGAVPIVAVTVARSFRTDTPLYGFYVRKDTKDHGMRSLIDGLDVRSREVILVEDVTTTGGSLLKAAQAVRDAGGWVSHAISVIDRLEGAAQALLEQGITLMPLFTRHDFQ
jgi:orotate phosphoribosyltransferase